LPGDLSFTWFRHGGFTETGDVGLTDRETVAQGRHGSPKGTAEICEADDEADRERDQKATRRANERRTSVRTTTMDSQKCSKTLERVKGIEPSYSAWKAESAAAIRASPGGQPLEIP